MIFIIYLPKGRGGRGVTQRWGLGEIFGRFFGFVALYVLYRYDFYYISALIRWSWWSNFVELMVYISLQLYILLHLDSCILGSQLIVSRPLRYEGQSIW